MIAFRSFRAKLQTAFVVLSLAAIGLTGWEASYGAAAALRRANYDRLTSIRETKRRQVEDYFRDVHNHVIALSSDESSIKALEEFQAAWRLLPPPPPDSNLRDFYEQSFAPKVAHQFPPSQVVGQWFPADPRHRSLQHYLISANPHPLGSKDQLLRPAMPGPYSDVHARYHPTLHRYQSAFGFYDVFLIGADEGRILYSVFKEVDLGASLLQPPYDKTGLARVFRRALELTELETSVIEDYEPYMPSHLAPAAFVAAPVWRAGVKVGVLAIQVSTAEINRVLTGNRNWLGEGMGRTGQAYLMGPDSTLRSDLREEIERPNEFYRHLEQAGIGAPLIDRIRRNRTAILTLPAPVGLGEALRTARSGTELGLNFRGSKVLRSFTALQVGELQWGLVAEIDESEVSEPIRSLVLRIVGMGLLIAAAFFAAAWWLARSVTRPVSALAGSVHRIGQGDFRSRVEVNSQDEIGQLAQSFNRMAEDLERTTVSRDDLDQANRELRVKQQELERLAGRLIEAQEEERRRLGRELHDDVTQRVAALAIEVGRLENMPGPDPVKLSEGFRHVKGQLIRISGDIHRLSRRLHSATIEDLGLAAAIEGECRGYFERGGAPVEFVVTGDLSGLSQERRLGLYRIVQEALRNIERHAGADEVRIDLRRELDSVAVEIVDNGRGFDRSSPEWQAGVGLASMEERARLLGGRFDLHSEPGRGTKILVHVPVDNV